MLQDLRLAFRAISRAPGFSALVIGTLALGIGANAAIFTVVDHVLLRPAPVPDLERLVMVWETDRHSGTTREPASVPDYLDFVARVKRLDRLAAFIADEANLSPPGTDPVRLPAMRVTRSFLPAMGITPVAGRTFTDEEDRLGGPRVVMISESLWTRAFGRAASALGGTLAIDDTPHVVVGVAADEADFGVRQILSSAAYARGFADRGTPATIDLWIPLQADPGRLPRDTHPLFVVGRLASGASVETAQDELTAITADLERDHRSNDGRGAFIEPLATVVFGSVRPAMHVLFGTVGLVLLVACVNVAHMLLARAPARMREVAVRAALGAGGSRLVGQFLVEHLVLSVLAAAAGVVLAGITLRFLLALAPADVPRIATAGVDARMLGASLFVAVLTGLAFALVPTIQARRLDLQQVLRGEGGGRASAGRGHAHLRAALVVTEMATAVVLLVAAGLLGTSFWKLMRTDAGFQAGGVLKAEYRLPPSRYPADFRRWPDFAEMHAFTGALLERVAALPGVTAAAVSGAHPLDPGFTNSFVVVGREAEAASWPEISVRQVTPGYFRTVGLPLVRGRLLQEADTTRGAPVLVVNEAAARRFFPSGDPIGAQIRFWGTSRTVVGVVANELFQGLTTAAPVAVYVPLAQAPSAAGAGVLLVRTASDPRVMASAVRGAIREIDAALPVFGVEPLTDTVLRSVGRERFTMQVIGAFALLAMIMAALGIHGVLSHDVAVRTREIGIRMALGARPDRILRMIVGEGMGWTLLGLALGLAASAALSRLLASLLHGVGATDPATFAVASAVLLIVAAAACYFPARRAVRVEPAKALRGE